MSRVLTLNPIDDVAIALDDIAIGQTPQGLDASACADIATGHKIARHAVAKGGLVRRYGQVIGRASTDIAAGDHVHVHNLAMAEDGREAEVGADAQAPTLLTGATFQGIVRPDGRIGTRNYIGVLTSVNLPNPRRWASATTSSCRGRSGPISSAGCRNFRAPSPSGPGPR